ncbi:MAG: tRNA (adenosine(37)-N6)-threonylcarbamoyltransferase complex ATPase subunit type 1 TsaE [candidate division FCPU426 bacterium]
MDNKCFSTASESETEAVGELLAPQLRPGDVVALTGELGSGKTCLTRGLARGLGASGPVTSPTFNLLHEYAGPLPVYHFDLYRLKSAQELEDLGWEEYSAGNGVCVLEWAERAGSLLPAAHWAVRFEIADAGSRRVCIQAPKGRDIP